MSMAPSSPRLPSPPPPAEIQLGPKSPLMGPNAARQAVQIEQTTIETNAKRRIHPGTKAANMAAGPPLVPLQELDSAFQLQEHLAALHYHHTAKGTIAITRETARLLATPPAAIDKTLWLYELCRFLIAQCNNLIVGFLFDTPACSAATCPEMRASEWQFLCAVHDQPKSCCAIDYCCHTLDWAANVVTNPKIFPSRFVVDAPDKNTALKNLINVFRRLHRIFAHAWFQHRSVFWTMEAQTGLYILFKMVCDVYDLLPAENYKLPPEAEGLESGGADDKKAQPLSAPVTIAKPPARGETEDETSYPGIGRTNTRRHIKSSPSTGRAVTTVPEADEDDEYLKRLGNTLYANAGPGREEAMAKLRPQPPFVPLAEHQVSAKLAQSSRPASVVPPPGLEVQTVAPVAEDTSPEESEAESQLTTAPAPEPQPQPLPQGDASSEEKDSVDGQQEASKSDTAVDSSAQEELPSEAESGTVAEEAQEEETTGAPEPPTPTAAPATETEEAKETTEAASEETSASAVSTTSEASNEEDEEEKTNTSTAAEPEEEQDAAETTADDKKENGDGDGDAPADKESGDAPLADRKED